MPSVFIIVRALLVRIIFAVHGFVTVWRLTVVTQNAYYWFIVFAIAGLAVETSLTLYKKRGQDWKWFCPSVMFYLMCVVPAIWFLELHELDKRLFQEGNFSFATGWWSMSNETATEVELSAYFGRFGLDIPRVIMTSDEWVKTLGQILLLILILGRWMLPKGKLSHDQLSQLLLVYIGTASDIVELFEAFKEDEVKCNRVLCIVILSIWSLSLMQFTMVMTATKARKDKAGLIPNLLLPDDDVENPTSYGKHPAGNQHKFVCCTPDVYGGIISILMQDVPFLVFRMVLIFKYGVLSYSNMFFTCKNTLVCSLLVYRLIVVQIERRRVAVRRFRHWASVYHASRGGSDPASSSVVRLVTMAKSASSIASSATAVLRRSQSNAVAQPTETKDDGVQPRQTAEAGDELVGSVSYVILRHLSDADQQQQQQQQLPVMDEYMDEIGGPPSRMINNGVSSPLPPAYGTVVEKQLQLEDDDGRSSAISYVIKRRHYDDAIATFDDDANI